MPLADQPVPMMTTLCTATSNAFVEREAERIEAALGFFQAVLDPDEIAAMGNEPAAQLHDLLGALDGAARHAPVCRHSWPPWPRCAWLR